MADKEGREHEERALMMARLEVLDALVAAIERRDEVFQLIVSSPSAEQACVGLVALLGVSEIGAVAILDLQWRRLAELERARIIAERDEIRSGGPQPASAASDSFPSSTVEPVAITSGVTAGMPWTLWATLSPFTGSRLKPPAVWRGEPPKRIMFGPGGGLRTHLAFSPPGGVGLGGGSGPGGNPATMPPIVLNSSGPGTDFAGKLIIGISTVPATTIRIHHAGDTAPIIVTSVTNAELPGFRFFVVSVPIGHIDSIEALSKDNRVLATVQPDQIPQGP